MYSLYPAGAPGDVWAGGVAVFDSDVGVEVSLSTSFRGGYGQPPSPFSFIPFMDIPSPAFGREKKKKKKCFHTHFPFGKASGVFLATLLVWFVFFI